MMPGKIEKAEMLPILVRAEECAEKADALYKQMYNFIWEEHERGKSDIAEEDWNGIVRPLEEQACSYMEKALGGGTYWKSCRLTGVAAPINMLD